MSVVQTIGRVMAFVTGAMVIGGILGSVVATITIQASRAEETDRVQTHNWRCELIPEANARVCKGPARSCVLINHDGGVLLLSEEACR